jgi:hypothetical protein
MAWLTTVRPDGQPDSVPVWFLVRDDETILVDSQPKKIKLRAGARAAARCLLGSRLPGESAARRRYVLLRT